ncbi:MAG: S8 family serine peptidase, partial [Candidatus Zixiibacteriota bacterium]
MTIASLRPSLTQVLLAILIITASSALGATRPSFITDQPVVIQKAPNVLTDQAREYLSLKRKDSAAVWVFFTDKGVFGKESFQTAASTVTLTDAAYKRRARIGREKILFVDLAVMPEYITEIEAIGARHRKTSRFLNAASFNLPMDKLDAVAALPHVAEIRPIAGFSTEKPDVQTTRWDEIPNKALGPDVLNYGSSFNQLNMINVTTAHSKGYHGEGVIVCMMDTGFRKSHEAFALHYLQGRVLAEWDFVFNDGNTANEGPDWSSQWNHGTLTWSTCGGAKDGTLYGPAYMASFLLAKTEDVRSETPVEEDNWVAALEWADSLGANVTSTSLGYSDWYTYSDFDGNTATITLAANTSAALGIVSVNSNGNGGPGFGSLTAPADAFDILAVGAVSSGGSLASFSSRGPTFDGRIKPEVLAQGVSTFSASAVSDAAYTTSSGTSLSAPLVAGAAALMVQAHPSYTPQLIRQAIMETADNAITPNNDYGWGIIDIDAALGWGASFDADITIAQAPATVRFNDLSQVTPLSWDWSFGDSDSSTAQNPIHLYTAPGAYDVSLTINTSFGLITESKSNFIVLLADTVTFGPDSGFAGGQVVLSVDATNSQEIERMVIPFQFAAVSGISFDSAAFGSRTSYFEQFSYIAWNPGANTYAVELRADNGGASPPLAAGSGEVLKLYFSTDSL